LLPTFQDNDQTPVSAREINTQSPVPTLTSVLKTTTQTPIIHTATETSIPTATLGVGATRVNENDGAEMVYVPSGEFLMGSEDEDAYKTEKPEHIVYLDGYWIYKHEVTNAQYQRCIEAGVCSGNLGLYSENENPAVYINWHMAESYCEWVGGRLPTEAEWEKAARGDDGRTYPWGETRPSCGIANYYGCRSGTAPVGSYLDNVSPYGALDMAGNVWEWVADWYGADYYAVSPYSNPTGPATGIYRVVRGGSWSNNAWYLRTSDRLSYKPDTTDQLCGFRCAFSP
jgi:formylglycine-generating enzyme required for sulfatase activity